MAKSRAELRTSIFKSENLQPKTEVVTFFGEEVEVRQPSMNTILNFRNADEADRKTQMVDMLIEYVFVPGTNEKVFETADKDQLLQMPFGQDMTGLQAAISRLTNVDLQTSAKAKNSDGTDSSSTS